MLNNVFAIRGLDLNKDQVLKDLIRACSSQPCRPDRDLSPWNFDIVLRFLSMAPFEPLRHSSTKDLTRETLFLVALGGGGDPSSLTQN